MILTDIIPSHTVAQWLLSHIHRFLDWFGLGRDKTLVEIIYVVVIVAVAVLVGLCLGYLIKIAIRKVIMVRNPEVGQQLVDRHVLSRCSHIVPPLLVLALLPFALTGESMLNTVIYRVTLVYTALVICLALCSICSFMWMRFEAKRNTRNLPLRGILDTVLGVIWVVTLIVCVAIVVDKSPAVLLGGLGAFAAVLMLVFKDSIMGFVSGVQLSANDMLKVGDWITMPKYGADGDVIEVSLNTVKVRNFDKTITTIPPYLLVSDSFQNWRGMQESGGRRIKRSINIDMNSVKFCTPEMLAKYRRIQLLTDYIDRTEEAIKEYNREHDIDNSILVNGSHQTNLGVFRAYLNHYLRQHPGVNHDMTCMVRQLQPTDRGIPLELYFFSSTTVWIPYENLQSDVFDHLLAIISEFDLRVFQLPSGDDFKRVLPEGASNCAN